MSDPVRPDAEGAALVRLCSLDEIPNDQAKGFKINGASRDTLFIVKKGGQISAYRNSCPHHPGAPMAWRKDAYLTPDRSKIICSAHGAIFNIDTGRCISGPCVDKHLQKIELITKNGTLYVDTGRVPHQET